MRAAILSNLSVRHSLCSRTMWSLDVWMLRSWRTRIWKSMWFRMVFLVTASEARILVATIFKCAICFCTRLFVTLA
jgi:hypothetical protein